MDRTENRDPSGSGRRWENGLGRNKWESEIKVRMKIQGDLKGQEGQTSLDLVAHCYRLAGE